MIGMALLKVEQETIILFNEAETTASVYTHNAALQRVLLELCQTHPAQVRQTEDNRCGGLTFELPKKWVKISPPRALSEAQKRVLDEMNQRNRERRKEALMAQKWQTISELAAETSRKVTHSPEEWCRFLTTAARFYKAYDFDDQLLIYAQKPNATACADMPTWNNKMRRWVNAGSTAIALIRKGYGGKPYLDYVHDVADTHPVRGGKDPWLWKLTEENREPIMERLRDTFGIDGSGDLGDLLMETAEKLVQESYGEYLSDLLYEREDSFLEELDDFNVEVLFRNTLRASVQYAVLSRCGLDVSRYLDAEDFREITNFNTTAALACLGTAVSQGSRELLLEIGDTIRKIEREKVKNSLAKSGVEPYNDKGNFSTLKRKA